MEWILSKCLLGDACRYDGKSKPSDVVCKLASKLSYKAVCPEVAGGLSTPRIPSEYNGSVVSNAEGTGVNFAYKLGAQYTTRLVSPHTCCCILKEKSPSCGSEWRYDGTFTKTLVPGEGMTSEALMNAGIPVVSESVVEELYEKLNTGITIVYRFSNILPALARRYTTDLTMMCADIDWPHSKIFVVSDDEDVAAYNPNILIDVNSECITGVFMPDINEVRYSHEARLEVLFDCLVAEALGTENLMSWAKGNAKNSNLICISCLNIKAMPYKDVIAQLYKTTLSLHDFLHIA